jgi:hypothetical protein
MTRRTYAYDADLDAVVQIRGPGSNHPSDPPSGMQIIRDIEPYRTAASDIAHEGKRVLIGSRSRHREFLRDNSYVEIGNERPVQGERPTMSRNERIEDIRRAMGDFGRPG